MRQLKFRAWRSSEMIYQQEETQASVATFFNRIYYQHPVMQFTGLKDKNGKEIYEGDIVSVEYGKGTVKFYSGCFWIEWIDDPQANMELLSISNLKRGTPRTDILVIGNIYENKQLINP